jgi:hypothetical protein
VERVKWLAIVVASVLALALGAYALTARGGGQRLRDIVPTTKPAPDNQAGDNGDDQADDNQSSEDSDDQAGNDQSGDDGDDQAGDDQSGDNSDDQAGDGQADGP